MDKCEEGKGKKADPKDKVDVCKTPLRTPLSEDVFSEKLDMCITDTAIKAGAGGIIGALSSLMFIRGRWPMIAGMGIGIGIAWANCEHELNTQTQKNQY